MKTCNSLSFTEKIRRRIHVLRMTLLLMTLYMIIIAENGGGDSRIMNQLATSISRILYFGGLIYICILIYRNKKLLRNKLLLKEKWLAEQDERTRLLHEKSGGSAMDIMLIFLLIATWTASLYNMAAFHTAFALLCAAVCIKVGLYIFYNHRS